MGRLDDNHVLDRGARAGWGVCGRLGEGGGGEGDESR